MNGVSAVSLGSTLEGGGSNLVYAMHDGTRITFSDPSGNPNFGATNFCKDNNQLSCTLGLMIFPGRTAKRSR